MLFLVKQSHMIQVNQLTSLTFVLNALSVCVCFLVAYLFSKYVNSPRLSVHHAMSNHRRLLTNTSVHTENGISCLTALRNTLIVSTIAKCYDYINPLPLKLRTWTHVLKYSLDQFCC